MPSLRGRRQKGARSMFSGTMKVPAALPSSDPRPRASLAPGFEPPSRELTTVGRTPPGEVQTPSRARTPTADRRFFKTFWNDLASDAVDARCVSPTVILHAHVPSGPTTMLVSTRSFPTSSALITMEPSSLTGTPTMPPRNVAQKSRATRSACHAAAASFLHPALESGMPIDPREHPAEHVVLFDDLRPQPEGRSRIEDLTSSDHADVLVAQLSGTRRRHRDMMRRH